MSKIIKFNISEKDFEGYMACGGLHYYGALSGEYEFDGNLIEFCRFFCMNPLEIDADFPETVYVSELITENLRMIKPIKIDEFKKNIIPIYTKDETNIMFEEYIKQICSEKWEYDKEDKLLCFEESIISPDPLMKIFTVDQKSYGLFELIKLLKMQNSKL